MQSLEDVENVAYDCVLDEAEEWENEHSYPEDDEEEDEE